MELPCLFNDSLLRVSIEAVGSAQTQKSSSVVRERLPSWILAVLPSFRNARIPFSGVGMPTTKTSEVVSS